MASTFEKVDPFDVLKAQRDIIALKMIISTMLVFMTEAKNGNSYDVETIRAMMKSLLDGIEAASKDDSLPETIDYFEDIETAIHDVFSNLVEDD